MPTNIITVIPTAETMRLHYGPEHNAFTDELLPPYYTVGIDYATPRKDATSMVLGKLRDELRFGSPDDPETLIKTSYAIARGIGDRFIADVSPNAFRLISASRSHGESFGMLFRDTSRNAQASPGAVDTVSSDGLADRPSMSIKMDEMTLGAENHKVVINNLHKLGAEIAPEDVGLLMLLTTVAHESGHIIQRGVGKLISPDEHPTSAESYDVMSRELLKSEPGLAQTIHEYTSIRVHNERFAEGYARIVLREAAMALGYDAATVDKIARALSVANLDQTMQQHLAAVTKEKGYAEVARESGLEDAYDGELGYALPLSPEQVILDLEYMYAKQRGNFDEQLQLRAKLITAYTRNTTPGEALEEKVSPVRQLRGKAFGRGVLKAIRQRLTGSHR